MVLHPRFYPAPGPTTGCSSAWKLLPRERRDGCTLSASPIACRPIWPPRIYWWRSPAQIIESEMGRHEAVARGA
jgi:hypothetical protein